jgi:hypothetical protein
MSAHALLALLILASGVALLWHLVTRRRLTPAAVLLLAALPALVVHLPALDGGFVFHDDYRYVVNNRAIEHVGNPLRFVTELDTLASESPTRDIYRPVRTLSYAVIVSLWGKDSAAPFHALAILLHAGTTALLAALLLRAGAGSLAALAGALAFGLHPATVEVTAWVCSLGDAWCGLFSVAAVLLYAGDRRVLAHAALALALLSKEHAVVVPGLWLAWDVCLRPERLGLGAGAPVSPARALPRALLGGVVPGLAVVVGFLLYRSHEVGARMAQVEGHLGGSLVAAVLTMTAGLGWYGATILFPYGPTFDAVVDVRETVLDAGVLLGLLVLGALAWALARGRGRVRLGVAWFLLALVPVSNVLVPLKIPTADRFLYLPLMGLSFCLAGLVEARALRLRLGSVGIPAAAWIFPSLALAGMLTVVRVGDWRSSEDLLNAGLRVHPKSRRLIWEEAAVAAEKAVNYLLLGEAAAAEQLAGDALTSYDRYLRNSYPGEQLQVLIEVGDLQYLLGEGRARYAPDRRREAKSRALEAYVSARARQREGVGQTTEEETRHVATRIVELAAQLAEPNSPDLGRTIGVGLEAAAFLGEHYGYDDTPVRIVFRLADSVRIRGQEPEKAREGLDWVLDAVRKLEAGGRELPFERAQALFYRSILRDRDPDRAAMERAFAAYQEAAQDRRIRLRALTYAGRCACTIARLFDDPAWEEKGRQLLLAVPGIAQRDGLRLEEELLQELRTFEGTCGG